jgi:hypothetical protein
VFIVDKHIIAGIFQKISFLSFFEYQLEGLVGVINHSFPKAGHELTFVLIEDSEGDSFVVKEREGLADGGAAAVDDADIVPDFGWDADEV